MKKGQLMSQPFFYIFAIVVIGLILVFGFNYINKLLKTSCDVEGLGFQTEIQSKVNELNSLSAGSSFECTLSRYKNSGGRCDLTLPDNVNGICFIDTTKSYTLSDIKFNDVKDYFTKFGAAGVRNLNKNLFFSGNKNADCGGEPVKINKLTTEGAVCANLSTHFILENQGDIVIVKKA